MSQWLHLPDDPHSNDKADFLWWSLNPAKPHSGTNDVFLLTEEGINILTEDDILMVSEESP